MRGYLWLCNDHSHEGSLDVTSLALAITSYPPDTFGQKVARSRSSRQAIASASHDGDNCHMIYHKSQRRNERGGISFLTLAHPERPYIYICRFIEDNQVEAKPCIRRIWRMGRKYGDSQPPHTPLSYEAGGNWTSAKQSRHQTLLIPVHEAKTTRMMLRRHQRTGQIGP